MDPRSSSGYGTSSHAALPLQNNINNTHGSSVGPPPPYVSTTNHIKYNPPSHHHHHHIPPRSNAVQQHYQYARSPPSSFAPPPMADESRCPPSDSRRDHNDDDTQRILPPPHPADKFGKTIIVSSRTNIDDPVPSRHRVGGLVEGVRFSPSKSGAFLPYRSGGRCILNVGPGQPPAGLAQPKMGEYEMNKAATTLHSTADKIDEEDSDRAYDDEIVAFNSKMIEESCVDTSSQEKLITASSSNECSDHRVSMKISESGSKDTASNDGGTTKTSNDNDDDKNMTNRKPLPIATNSAQKRPRSSARDGGEQYIPVSVNDDTPKHINIRNQGGAFHFPSSRMYHNKRTKVTDLPPDLSQMSAHQDHHTRRSYSIDTLEDKLATRGASFSSYHRDPPISYTCSKESLGGGDVHPHWSNIEPSAFALDSQSLSWDAAEINATGSMLSFGLTQTPSYLGYGMDTSPNTMMMSLSPNKNTTEVKDDNMVIDGDFPPLPSCGSLPMKKRGITLAPRLSEPPLPRISHHSDDRTLEARDGRETEREGDTRELPLHDYRDQPPSTVTSHYPPFSQGGYCNNEVAAPWGNPTLASSGNFPPPYNYYNDYGDDSRSLEDRSFRSLGELEEPMQSLLYRPSFSWERGLDVHNTGMTTSEQYNETTSPLPPLHVGSSTVTNPLDHLIPLPDQQRVMKALAMRSEIRTIGNPSDSQLGMIMLLAMPDDQHCLSETLCIVRNNIEVFSASETDCRGPSPGRKKSIEIGQMGLRCVYCRLMPKKDRVKRSCCFPASTKRIYRAVIDMKLDHFKHCPCVPADLKAKLEELEVGKTRSTGITVSYFVNAAKMMGMVDMENGVCIDLRRVGLEEPLEISNRRSGSYAHKLASPNSCVPRGKNKKTPKYPGKVLMAVPDDENFLSPLRCFLRENIYVYTATSSDIASRVTTALGIVINQVGIGCKYCLRVPPKDRTSRGNCFPYSISRIYQSVADIQRFHFPKCKNMPADAKDKFIKLQAESAKGSKGLSTRKYWTDSAKALGLADGCDGIYFCRDISGPPPPLPILSETLSEDTESLIVLAQVASNTNATPVRELVTVEDKPTIAGFLYLCMEQIRPCTFTEADRNKRREKKVGTIGVECKHCSGTAESRKYFWSNIAAAESNFVSVHSHLSKCKYVPDEIKTELARLRTLRRTETMSLKVGSQKAFFSRVWARLHGLPVPRVPVPREPKKANAKKKKKAALHPKDTKKAAKKTVAKKETVKKEPPSIIHAPSNDDQVHDFDEIRVLSSMPSIADSEVLGMNSSFELKTLSNDSSDIHPIASKNSLLSVALDLSAVSVQCKEEEEKEKKITEI